MNILWTKISLGLSLLEFIQKWNLCTQIGAKISFKMVKKSRNSYRCAVFLRNSCKNKVNNSIKSKKSENFNKVDNLLY
jgi:hypothetical protein